MPAQGSDLARAMQLGVELLQQTSLNRGRMLLVTDEDQPELFLDASRQLKQQGFELAVLGIGSPEGAPIPKPEGGFFKDAAGNMILPQLNINGLQQLARAGGGSYHSLTVDDTDLRSLLAGLDEQHLDPSKQTTTASVDRWREEGIWLLLPLTLLAALAFRRGWLLVLPLVLLMPTPAEALDWQELWRTPDQQAAQSFVNKDYDEAAQKFENVRWKASALYRDGKYTEAAELIKDPQTADDWYNKGNALAKTGNLPDALKAYQQAIEIEPDQADARFNKELVEEALQKQDQEQEQEKQEQEKQDQEKQGQNESGEGDQQQPSEDKSGSSVKENGKSQDQPTAASDEPQDKDKEQNAQDKSDGEKDNSQKTSSATQPSDTETAEEQPEEKNSAASEPADEMPESAEQRESRLLLQQIPDDPGGLLRRKFHYQYRQRGRQTQTDKSW
jgi:Ca-activated chloride channel family protein